MRPPAPPPWPRTHGLDRSLTAQKARHQIAVELFDQSRFVGVGDGTRREAAGEMDRRPRREAFVQAADRARRRGRDRRQLDALVLAVGEALRLAEVDEGDGAVRAGFQQRADDGRAERAGAAGDHNVTPSEIHFTSPSELASRGCQPSTSSFVHDLTRKPVPTFRAHALSAPALDPLRQHLEFDPVRHLARPQPLVEHIMADAVAPGQSLTAGIAVEQVEVVGESA